MHIWPPATQWKMYLRKNKTKTKQKTNNPILTDKKNIAVSYKGTKHSIVSSLTSYAEKGRRDMRHEDLNLYILSLAQKSLA